MRYYRNGMFVIFLLLVVIVVGCGSPNGDTITSNNSVGNSTNVEKIEIYHFHATHQCVSCQTVGAYAEETVNLFFSEELKSGKIVFGHINVDLPENAELVKKYGVSGSSLWIGVYDSSSFHKEENVNVWYKINNKDDYLLYLKGVINKRLNGDYSQ